VERVEELALVLVEALDLHVEERIRIDGHAELALDELGERLLVAALHRGEARAEGGIVDVLLEALEALEIGDPLVADALGDERGEARVAGLEPAPRGDAVGLVVEALRPELVEVAEQVALDELGVELGDAVDGSSRPRRGGPCAPAARGRR
jgi:hypothetical protein